MSVKKHQTHTRNFKVGSKDIAAGGGYSSDTQQVVAQLCYNSTALPVVEQPSIVRITRSFAFNELQTDLNVHLEAKSKFWIFSGSAEAKYMRSMQDKDYSLSVNYYSYFPGKVTLQLPDKGVAALSASGKNFYGDGTNPYFGIICGNNYLTAYQLGALLVMGININFRSHSDKETFEAKVSGSFGTSGSAAAEIQKITNQYNIRGSLSMQAFQIGGNPSRLANILVKDPSGDYYALNCSLASMEACNKAANGMLDYAKNDFAHQFSFSNNTGLVPTGVGFIDYNPIAYIGLNSTSLVTPEVIADRVELASALIENQYYLQKFGELINGYPVQWDIGSAVYRISNILYHRAQSNIGIVMNSNPDYGAIGCYNFPDHCNDITKTIRMELQPITKEDLKVLDAVKVFKGCYTIDLYQNGNTPSSWAPVALTPTGKYNDHFKQLVSASITDTSISVSVLYYGHHDTVWCALQVGTSTDGVNYQGTIKLGSDAGCSKFSETYAWNGVKIPSNYYFPPFSGIDSADRDESGLLGASNAGEASVLT